MSSFLPKLESLEGELADLHRGLPPANIFNGKNMLLRIYTPGRTTFVMFHIWWHQCHCDLYRFTIPGFREALSTDELWNLPENFASYCRKRCLEHALGVSKIISSVIELGKDIFITDPSLAMCAFHSARIIFRLGQRELENLPTMEIVKSLSACSKILDIQAEIYPTTKLLQHGIQDLIHNAQSASTGSSPMLLTRETENSSHVRNMPLLQSAVQTNPATDAAYSKYSIAEEIRNLEFPSEEPILPPSLGVESDRDQSVAQNETRSDERHVAIVTLSDEDTQLQGITRNAEFFLFGPEPRDTASTPRCDDLWYPTEDRLPMMLGLDLDESLAQPDIFLDAFFQENSSIIDGGDLHLYREGL